jgi:hypothetical protein
VGLFGKQALNAKSASKNIARTAIRQRVRDIDTFPRGKQRLHLPRQNIVRAQQALGNLGNGGYLILLDVNFRITDSIVQGIFER